jgi:type 1 glutamine amidotransferase/sugar phosphate isomerase/epimerase
MKTRATVVAACLVLVGYAAGAGAQAQQPREFPRAADAYERVSWRTRTLVGDERLTNWKFAVPATGVAAPTLWDAAIRADAALVNLLEASAAQKVGGGLDKNFDYHLTPAERTALKEKLGLETILTYRVDPLPNDTDSRRKLFAFAKDMGIATIVVPFTSQFGGLDALGNEFDVNIAVLGGNAAVSMKVVEGLGRRVGIGIDTGDWAQTGLAARDGLAMVKDRLVYVRLRDRSGRSPNARNVMLGKGVGNLAEVFNELNRLGVRPLSLVLDTSGIVKAAADLFPAVAAFEDVVQPAYAANFIEFSKTRPIRRDLGTPERQRIVAAIPPKPAATPTKARNLLVMESLEGMSHSTIPHANVMIEEMGRKTGAWRTVFSNDLNNLRYPKIKEYDAVFLNSIVGEWLPDPKIREDLVRYIKEGGGIGGIHGTPWASRNWNEFAEIIGSQGAPHRIENGVMKVYDKNSRIVSPFHLEDLPFQEEYYRFEMEGNGRLRWDKVRVLLTVALDDPKVEPRPWNGYKRADNMYPVAWIRSYGKGRMFYNSLGHMAETFMKPEIVGHLLAGIQFMLGDLDADTTPNPRK